MTRRCCGCLSMCCLSRKKRKSFPIHEKQRDTEVSKVFIRHVETIRRTPPPPSATIINRQQDKKTKSKATIKNLELQSSEQNNDSSHISNLFRLSKQLKTPSPLPMTTNDIIEDKHNSLSSWSSSTSSDLKSKKKNSSNHRSSVETYDISKENASQKKNIPQAKPSGKSKLVLENVRKMMKDQNIQQQHFNNTRQKESARL